tara:strand:+ start:458 stop:1423 length:966 start_codon:yes stop_codon:yes gene_type:complete
MSAAQENNIKYDAKNIHDAFSLWRSYIDANSNSKSPGLFIFSDLQRAFSLISLQEPIEAICKVGVEYEFAPQSIINILILHGGYFRLLKAGLIQRSSSRFVDSLYQPSFPSLSYNCINLDINAPWITLSAQEALLDINLPNTSVVEYGSGISTFFFARSAKSCYSFEDDEDPAGEGGWNKQMVEMSKQLAIEIHLISPTRENTSPEWVLNNLVSSNTILLINIDGIDRSRHFSEWSKYITENQQSKVVILLDNSDIDGFRETFEYLHEHEACIFHHYGNVYGQSTTKQCTSFITFQPKLLVGSSPAPSMHDKRWGKLNFQP